MRHVKTVQMPAKKMEVLDKVTCDLCGEQIEHERGCIDEVEVLYRSGTNYPDGSFGDIVEVDMCSQCFETKLVPWLREQGAEPRTTQWG